MLHDSIKVNHYGKNSGFSCDCRATFEDITTCPSCGCKINPDIINPVLIFKSDSTSLSVQYFCTNCNSSFIAEFDAEKDPSKSQSSSLQYFRTKKLNFVAPKRIERIIFDPLIEQLSPNFVEIYNQAMAAESYDLNQMSGIGLRKALEFLIKDFLIAEIPVEKEIIEGMPLGKCIQDKIDNPQLQIASQRATWLGNDQTHYVQKYEDKDIDDLKRLIRLSVHWVSLILETKEAETIEKK